MQWHVFDQGLGEWTGHWENFNKGLAREFARRGERATFYGHRQASENIVEGLDYRPLFTHYPWVSLHKNPIKNAKAANNAVTADLKSFASSCIDSGDVLMFSTVTAGDFPAVTSWASRQCRERGAKAVFLLQFADGLIDSGRVIPWAAEAFRKAWVSADCPASLFAASAELAAAFSHALDRRVQTMCMPRYALPASLKAAPRIASEERECPVVGYFGHASLEKGAHLLQEIIEATATRYPCVRWLLQINPNVDSERLLKCFHGPVSNTTCVHGHLSSEKYFDLLSQTDIVLLPYQQAKYATTPSAVFAEALGLDKVLVIPANTWLARQAVATEAAVTKFTEFSTDSITAALWQAIEDWGQLRIAARAAGTRWRDVNSAERFVSDIAAALGTHHETA